jgi:transcriptional activator SPT7
MDFQTMLKKVKQKQYKSKREFKDDLDLIWSNCYMYNATEVCGLLYDKSPAELRGYTEPPFATVC